MTEDRTPAAQRAVPLAPHGAASIRGVLDQLREPAYLQLLGKSVGTGFAVGMIARRVPAIALPLAMLGGIYVGMEIAAYVADQALAEELGPWIDASTREIDDGAE